MSNEYLQTIFFFRKNGVMNWSHLRKGTIPYSYKHLQINYLEIHTVFYVIGRKKTDSERLSDLLKLTSW